MGKRQLGDMILKKQLQEIVLYLTGWEKYEGKWIHMSGRNKYPRTTEEAWEILRGRKCAKD